jgi:endonuclease YncB( thermonuclease family)
VGRLVVEGARGLACGMLPWLPHLLLTLALWTPVAPGQPLGQDSLPLQGAAARVLTLDRDAPGGAVIDGDSIRLTGLDRSVRLVGIDCEEVFHGGGDRELADRDFPRYVRRKQQGHARPAKYATPAGMAARDFALEFFREVTAVQLVPDDPAQPTGYYGRYLGHLLVDLDGDGVFETSYGVELVRLGHSPYFVKYGYSRRCHEELQGAQEEARRAERGIWNPRSPIHHYPDYEERLAWWHRRAKALRHYEAEQAHRPLHFLLGRDADMERLRTHAREVPGTLVTIAGVPRTPTAEMVGHTIYLSHRNRQDLPVRFPDRQHWERVGLLGHEGELVALAVRVYPTRIPPLVEARVDDTAAVHPLSSPPGRPAQEDDGASSDPPGGAAGPRGWRRP